VAEHRVGSPLEQFFVKQLAGLNGLHDMITKAIGFLDGLLVHSDMLDTEETEIIDVIEVSPSTTPSVDRIA